MTAPLDLPTTFARRVARKPDPAAWADAPVLLLAACDAGYLPHAIALARSLDAFAPQAHLLLHLVNPDEAAIDRVRAVAESLSLKLHLSVEKAQLPDAAMKPAYYASARFMLMAELLAAEGSPPILALDADALAVGPLSLDFSDKPEAEICLRRRDLEGPVEDHMRVAAGAVWAKPTPGGIAFMAAVASDLQDAFASGTAKWFVDQEILGRHVLAETGGAHVRNLKSKFADWGLREDSIFWTGKGDRKYLDIRYVLLREAFDEDPARRDAARALYSRVEALVPHKDQGGVAVRARKAFARARRTRTAVFLPRLDLPWKQGGMRANGGAPVPSDDTVELRLWWKRFTMELMRMLTQHGAEPRQLEIPAWEITPERVDAEDVDLAFVPHRCHLDFGPTRTPRRFYMQEYFRPVFVVDPSGWSASSSVYPVDASKLPPAVLGAWDDYHAAFMAGNLHSKFGQSLRRPREVLEAMGDLPTGRYVFFPLQIPHDQSIRYFSDYELGEALAAALALARARQLTLVLKEHPANRPSTAAFRQQVRGPDVFWSDAHLHDLLSHADGVVTINSGAGFEALLAGKPVVSLGRAEYDVAAHRGTPETLREAWDAAVSEPPADRLQRYARFVDWFLGRHAVDLSRPVAGRHVLDRIVRHALAEAKYQREAVA